MIRVKGSLRKHLDWWQTNINNPNIVQIVAEGYRLPLIKKPDIVILKNNRSARENEQFVDSELASLLESGVIHHVTSQPHVINALSVATNHSGKQRLVLDLRTVNPLLNVDSFKYEDIQTVSNYLQPGCYFASFDLKQGYHHVDIHPAYRTYMGFAWRGKNFVYTSCPFGISSGGLVFFLNSA
jgi:hypothetical protein